MSSQIPFVITISRQLGSGGAYLGQRIAARLHIYYADRDVIRRAAGMLHMPEDNAEPMSKRSVTILQSLLKSFNHTGAEADSMPSESLPPLDDEFHVNETPIVTQIAQNWHSVIVGRGGYHLLRDNPRHLAVYIHANPGFRSKRIQEVYGVSPTQAARLIETSDWSRRRFLRIATGTNWDDTRQYHLSLDTSTLGFALCEELILDSMLARLENTLDPKESR